MTPTLHLENRKYEICTENMHTCWKGNLDGVVSYHLILKPWVTNLTSFYLF